MTDDEQTIKKRRIDDQPLEINDKHEVIHTEDENTNQVKLRIWRPTIPKYAINPAYYDDIIKAFIRKTDYKSLKMLDPVYADQIEFTQDINKLQELKPQFEAKHLRLIDMILLKEAATTLRNNENMMCIYYEMKELERNEQNEKCLVIIKAYINDSRVYLDRIQELREVINQFILEAEECWSFLLRLHYIANKR